MNTVFTATRTKGFGLQLKAFVYFLIIEFLKILIQKKFLRCFDFMGENVKKMLSWKECGNILFQNSTWKYEHYICFNGNVTENSLSK